jgi:transcriptional regulator with XRE-family HTH domain
VSKDRNQLNTEILAFLEKWRADKNLSQSKLAKEIGILGLSVYVREKFRFGIKNIKKIDNYFGTDFASRYVPPIPSPSPTKKKTGIQKYNLIPVWVCTAPEAVRPYVEQEWPINEALARELADKAKTYEDVKAIRAAWRAI